MNDQPPEFDDMFDEDGEVIATEQAELSPQPQPAPIPTNIIQNTNQQIGAEWNLFYYDPSGFDCHLKLHSTSGTVVLQHAANAMLDLLERGCIPKNGAPTITTAEPTREDLPADGTASQTTCPIHHVPMKLRTADNGDTWFSHKTDDPAYKKNGGWCRGV